MITQFAGQQGFIWFIGTVVDLADPRELGRVRVRAVSLHDGLEDEDLPWAQVLISSSESHAGVGLSPNRLTLRSKVVGFFLDGQDYQLPMVLGSFHTIPGLDDSRHDVHPLARGTDTFTNTPIGPEPSSSYAAAYPFNRTLTTESGHAVELDDTPGAERIRVIHKAGTYIEISPSGSITIKTPSDQYQITGGNNVSYSVGNIDSETKQSYNVRSNTSITLSAPGGMVINGSVTVRDSLVSGLGATGTFTTPSGQTVSVVGGVVQSIGG